MGGERAPHSNPSPSFLIQTNAGGRRCPCDSGGYGGFRAGIPGPYATHLQSCAADGRPRRSRGTDAGRLRPRVAEAVAISGRVLICDLAAPPGRERDHRAVPIARHGARGSWPTARRCSTSPPRSVRNTSTSRWICRQPSNGCLMAPGRSSCSTMSKATGTKRSATCSACRPARRSRNCIAHDRRCAGC